MAHIADIESLESARLVLKAWEPQDETGAELRAQMLDYIDIAENERDRLREQGDVLYAEQQQMEMALCYIKEGISINSADNNIRLVNPAFEALTGFKGDDIIGMHYGEVWGDIDELKIAEIRKVTESGRNWEGILNVKSKSGERLRMEATVVPIIHYSGQITHFVYALHNITKRMELEENLTRQEQFFEKVINLNPGIIIILDEDGKWMLDNLAAKTLITDLGDGAREKLSSLLVDKVKKKKIYGSQKITIPLSDGAEVVYMIFSEAIPSTYLIPDSEEKEVYLITLSDITEIEKKSKEILIRQKALLASRIEKNMVQGEFINGFLYQAQKPFNIVRAGISRIQKALEKERPDQIETAICLMNGEIATLEKEFEKYSSMRQDVTAIEETTDAIEMREAMKILYKEQYTSKRLNIQMPLVDEVTYPLPYEVMQLLTKILIDNALDCPLKKGATQQTRITFDQNKEWATLIVEDNGPGIPKKDRHKVFEPFYTTKKNHSGLSLAILLQLMNKVKGSVDISRSDLGGTKATLYFPMES